VGHTRLPTGGGARLASLRVIRLWLRTTGRGRGVNTLARSGQRAPRRIVRPTGEGQRILSALKDGGVNLLAFLGFPLGGGQSQIDLVPEDPESLRDAAEGAGITLSGAKRAFLIPGDDRVGAAADVTAKLAEANVNLTAAAAASAGSGRYG
jgi:hypothetical protein